MNCAAGCTTHADGISERTSILDLGQCKTLRVECIDRSSSTNHRSLIDLTLNSIGYGRNGDRTVDTELNHRRRFSVKGEDSAAGVLNWTGERGVESERCNVSRLRVD